MVSRFRLTLVLCLLLGFVHATNAASATNYLKLCFGLKIKAACVINPNCKWVEPQSSQGRRLNAIEDDDAQHFANSTFNLESRKLLVTSLSTAVVKAKVTKTPSKAPSTAPSRTPSKVPTVSPTSDQLHTRFPTARLPTRQPTNPTTRAPSRAPQLPTPFPTWTPTRSPKTSKPTKSPSTAPTISAPTSSPITSSPSFSPTANPTGKPTLPTRSPTSRSPTTAFPTRPTLQPSKAPSTSRPSNVPITSKPSRAPSTSNPSVGPSLSPQSSQPSASPSTSLPTGSPSTSSPSTSPGTKSPTRKLTSQPTRIPTRPTRMIVTGSPFQNIPPTQKPLTLPPTWNPSSAPPSRPPRETLQPFTTAPSLFSTLVPTTHTPKPSHPPSARPQQSTLRPVLQKTKSPFRSPTMKPTFIQTNPPIPKIDLEICLPKCSVYKKAGECPTTIGCMWTGTLCWEVDTSTHIPTQSPVEPCRNTWLTKLPMQFVSELVISPLTGYRVAASSYENRALLLQMASSDNTISGGLSVVSWLEGHSDKVVRITFSYDEQQVATCSLDRTAIVHRASSGAILFVLKNIHTGACVDIAYSRSPSIKRVVTASHDSTAVVWSSEGGNFQHRLIGHTAPLTSVQFSPSRNYSHIVATASFDGRIIIWDSGSGAALTQLVHEEPIYAMSYSPDGALIVAVSHTISVWDTSNGRLLQHLQGSEDIIKVALFTRLSDQLLSLGVDGVPMLWDLQTGRLINILETNATISGVAFKSNDEIITVDGAEGVRAWSPLGVGPYRRSGDIPNATLWSIVAFPGTSKVLVGGLDGSLTIWECP